MGSFCMLNPVIFMAGISYAIKFVVFSRFVSRLNDQPGEMDSK
jgi:hypothetical protein